MRNFTLKQILKLRRIGLSTGLIAASLGLAVLVGWAFDIPSLKSVFPGLVTMKANTAMGMLLCGTALMFMSSETITKPIRFFVMIAAGVAIALGALTLVEDIFEWNLGIDQWLFRDVVGAVDSSNPGRMSPSTAFCF